MKSYIQNKEELLNIKELQLKERELILKEKAYDIIETKAEKYIRKNLISKNSVGYVDSSLAVQEGLIIITVIGVLIFILAPFML